MSGTWLAGDRFYPDNEGTLSSDRKFNFGFTTRYKDGDSTGKLNIEVHKK